MRFKKISNNDCNFELTLEEYEEICPKCGGASSYYLYSFCDRCNNRGKVDWIDKIKRTIFK